MIKHMKIFTLVLLMMWPLMAFSQVEFIEVVTLEEMEAAQKKADDGMLMLFVDVYATWCGPCKMMDRDVYTDPAVAEYMNANFVNVRMDGETDYGRKYAAAQQLQGYPSMFVFSDEGDHISSIVGFKPATELLPTLRGLVDNYAAVRKYRKPYEDGTITMEAFAAYVKVVREMGNEEEAEKLAGEYIKKRMGATLSDHDIRVVAFYMDLEDPWWPEFTIDPGRIQRVLGEDYLPALEIIYNNTLLKAVEQESIILVSRMANELSPLVETAQSESWDLKSLPFLQYYYYTEQVEELITYVDRRFVSDRKGDHRWLFGAASQIIDMDQKQQTPELLEKGEEWFSTCIGLEQQYDYYFYHGMVLFFQQDRQGALASFETASTLTTTDEERAMIEQVLRYVNSR
jgi:thioredoxin-related protein